VAELTLNTVRTELIALIESVPHTTLKQIAAAVKNVLTIPSPDTRFIRTGSSGKPRTSARPLTTARSRGHFKLASQPYTQRRSKNGKPKLPKLPASLSWPTKKYSKEHKKSGIDIERFLRDEWSGLIEAGYGELRWLRIVDSSAVHAITYYERPDPATGKRRRLPKELHFLTEKEITDRKIASGLAAAIKADPRLAVAVASRVRRGLDVPAI
jgi:hypothetical protein